MENVYSPKDVNIAWNGIALTGYAPDSFVRVSRNSDSVTETVGSAGELALTKNADKTGNIEIELLQTSRTNLLLAGYVASYEYTDTPIIVGELTITDPSGSTLYFCHNAYIKRPADAELGAEQNSRVWTFGCEKLVLADVPAGYIPDVTGFTV